MKTLKNSLVILAASIIPSVISQAPAHASGAPVIVSTVAATGTVGAAFAFQIVATNNPTSYGASGLPSGLSINAATGVISGAPTTAGTSIVTVSATNAAGTGSASLFITVAAGSATKVHLTVTNDYTLTVASATIRGMPYNASDFLAKGNLGAHQSYHQVVTVSGQLPTQYDGFFMYLGVTGIKTVTCTKQFVAPPTTVSATLGGGGKNCNIWAPTK